MVAIHSIGESNVTSNNETKPEDAKANSQQWPWSPLREYQLAISHFVKAKRQSLHRIGQVQT